MAGSLILKYCHIQSIYLIEHLAKIHSKCLGVRDRSRYSPMVLTVISKQKHAKTVTRFNNHGDDDYCSTSKSVVFEYWLSTDRRCTKIGKQLYDQFEKGSKYEAMTQIMDGDLFVSGFSRKPSVSDKSE